MLCYTFGRPWIPTRRCPEDRSEAASACWVFPCVVGMPWHGKASRDARDVLTLSHRRRFQLPRIGELDDVKYLGVEGGWGSFGVGYGNNPLAF